MPLMGVGKAHEEIGPKKQNTVLRSHAVSRSLQALLANIRTPFKGIALPRSGFAMT